MRKASEAVTQRPPIGQMRVLEAVASQGSVLRTVEADHWAEERLMLVSDALDKLKELSRKWRRHAKSDCDPANGTAVIQMRGRTLSDAATQLDALIPVLEAEIAALREQMTYLQDHLKLELRLERAAALREAAGLAVKIRNGYVPGAEIGESILALIPPADRDALDAHDAEVRKPLYEALLEVMTWIRNWDVPFADDDEWLAALPRIEAALKGVSQ